MNVQQLKAFNAGGFTAAASAFETASQASTSSQSSLQAAGGGMGDWSGPAASAVNSTLSDMLDALIPAPSLLEGAQEVLESFVTAVTLAQDKLNTALAKAQSLGCTVAPDGTVTPPPQPAGEPPQVCYANPTQEAARVQAQNVYDNSPAVQKWKSATQQAPALQSAIQEALQNASRADSRASGDLSRAAGGAKAFTQVAGGNLGTPLSALTADQLGLQADGATWSQSFVAQATSLAKRAATDPRAATQLQHDYGNLARTDAAFAAAFLNRLGPGGIEQVATEEGYHAIRDNAASAGLPPPGQDPLLQFLSNALARGTAQIDDPVAQVDGNSVNSGWLQQLISASNGNQAPSGEQSVPGWWALGQVMAAASQGGQVPYSTTFLTTVGPAMVQWDKDHNGEGSQGDGYYGLGPHDKLLTTTDYTDPLVGLLTAARTNPVGDQQLLTTPMSGIDTPENGTAPSDILTYLINDHHWGTNPGTVIEGEQTGFPVVVTDFGGGSDNGVALGQAIQAATGLGVPGGTKLATEAFSTYGQTLQAEPDRAAQLAGMRDPMAHVLVNNYGAVESTILHGVPPADQGSSSTLPAGLPSGVDPATVGDPRALAYVVSQIAQDPHAYDGLQTAALLYASGQAHTAQFDPSLRSLGFIVEAHDRALISQGAAADFQSFQHAQEIKDTISGGIDVIPLPESAGPAGDFVKGVIGQIWDHAYQVQASNVQGDVARDLYSHDQGALNDYLNNAYPVGPAGSPQEMVNTEATVALSRGGSLAASYLNKDYVGVLPAG